MKRLIRLPVIAAIVLFVGIGALCGCGKKEEAAAPANPDAMKDAATGAKPQVGRPAGTGGQSGGAGGTAATSAN